jgi:hypothetical protein
MMNALHQARHQICLKKARVFENGKLNELTSSPSLDVFARRQRGRERNRDRPAEEEGEASRHDR